MLYGQGVPGVPGLYPILGWEDLLTALPLPPPPLGSSSPPPQLEPISLISEQVFSELRFSDAARGDFMPSSGAWAPIVSRALSSLPAAVAGLQRQMSPGPQSLFTFFHMRKSGGSMIREAVYRAAQRLGARSFIPCYPTNLGAATRIECDTYAPPLVAQSAPHSRQRPYDIVGGHIFRPLLEKWEWRWRSTLKPDSNLPFVQSQLAPQTPACLTVIREPLARVESCWNYRFVHGRDIDTSVGGATAEFKLFHLMDPASLDKLLPHTYSRYGEGCNNEAARLLASIGPEETRVNQLNLLNMSSPDQPAALGALSDVLQQLSKCVVGVLERCQATMVNLRAHLPWLAPEYDCTSTNVSANVLNRGEALPPDRKSTANWARLAAVVRRHNALDEIAYGFTNQLLTAQLNAQ
jgi:hypothetical protein